MKHAFTDELDETAAERGVLASGTVVGSYRIERAIAEGGMATVYEATHRVLPRRAAIKVMHQYLLGKWAARERLFQEARILEILDHPGVLRIHDVGLLDDDRPWIAMELVDGVTLADRLTVHGNLSPLEVIEILDGAAAALAAAHARGVIHRDLKPENVMLCRGADVLSIKVIDWGIARIQGEPTGRLTRANMTPGTPLYMSPEQARGKYVDGRSDIYALGVIACEALCGEPPFQGDSPLDVVIQHLTAEPESLRVRRADIPEALDRLVLDMLGKEPVDRPAIPEIHERLAAIAAELQPADGEAYDDVVLELEIDPDEDDHVDDTTDPTDAETDEVIELTLRARPRWTPPHVGDLPRGRAIVPDGETSEVAGEILPRRRAPNPQAGRAEVLGLCVTVLLTALMLFAALALPAFQLGQP